MVPLFRELKIDGFEHGFERSNEVVHGTVV